MASRILGMGDLLTLIEKAQKDFDEKQAEVQMEKMRQNTFDFNDFIEQMEQVQNMGPIEDLMKMIPGMANNPALKNLKVDPKDIAHIKAVVMSMTPAEREDPELLKRPSRKRRLAAGAGRPVEEVNRMLKQFNQMKTMMSKVMNGDTGQMEQMMNAMGGGMPGMGGLPGMPGMGGNGGGLGQKVQQMAMKRMARQIQKNKKKRKR